MTDQPVPAHPAATVVLIRDRPGGCEVLLVRRNAQLAFHGGAWVFPGGRVDAADYAGEDDIVAAARRAAVREAREEAGLVLRAGRSGRGLALGHADASCRSVSTPGSSPRRAPMRRWRSTAARSTIIAGWRRTRRWRRSAPARIELPPPTFVTITAIAPHGSARAALAAFGRDPIEVFEPRLFPIEGGAVTLYAGDAGYDGRRARTPRPAASTVDPRRRLALRAHLKPRIRAIRGSVFRGR